MLRSPLEVLIPGRPPHEVRDLATTRRTGWWTRGLIFRVRKGDRVWAWVSQHKRSSATPVFKGRLVADARGTRVVGTLNWTPYVGGIAVTSVSAVALLGWAVFLMGDGDLATAAVVLCGTALCGGLSVLWLRTFEATKFVESRRLTEEIQRMFAKRRRDSVSR